jgi:hypothetical protein
VDDIQGLRWIVELLQRLKVPFQAVGGLAATAYGARRPLADLDFYVPTGRLEEVAASAAAHVVRPPMRFQDESWDLTFMTLGYHGSRIELGGADSARYFDRRAGEWREARIDFDLSVERTVLGVRVPVIPLEQLIDYKRRLDREVDRLDVAKLVSANSGNVG